MDYESCPVCGGPVCQVRVPKGRVVLWCQWCGRMSEAKEPEEDGEEAKRVVRG
jgi:uncharacterized Zn finger protein (UPF0148 family)